MDERVDAPPGRYVADTKLARFLVEQFGPNPNLSDIERRSKTQGVKLLASSLSDYLAGREQVSTETVRRLAIFTNTPEETIYALLPDDPRRGRHKPGVGPAGETESLVDDIADAVVQRVMGEIGKQIAARPVETVHAGGPTGALTARLLELATGGVRPVLVDDPAILAEVAHAGRGVAWLEPSTLPAPGKIVRVGLDEPPRLKPYEPGDDVTGVVLILQVSPDSRP